MELDQDGSMVSGFRATPSPVSEKDVSVATEREPSPTFQTSIFSVGI